MKSKRPLLISMLILGAGILSLAFPLVPQSVPNVYEETGTLTSFNRYYYSTTFSTDTFATTMCVVAEETPSPFFTGQPFSCLTDYLINYYWEPVFFTSPISTHTVTNAFTTKTTLISPLFVVFGLNAVEFAIAAGLTLAFAALLVTYRRGLIEKAPTNVGRVEMEPATSSIPVVPTKFCRGCGAKIPKDSKFCEECGTKLALE